MRFKSRLFGYNRAETNEYFRLLEFEGQWLKMKIREQEQIHSSELLEMVSNVEALRKELSEIESGIQSLAGNQDST